MKNTVTLWWNGHQIAEAKCSNVLAVQMAELMCNEFAGSARADALAEVHGLFLLSGPMSRPLPATTFVWGDDTGTAEVRINA